jgi:pimeloyl-ACP methyl ester carboxylesterase
VVGHDWGGAIAYHLAARHPEVVDRLVVINCPHPAVLARRMWKPSQLARLSYMLFFQIPWLPEKKLSENGGAAIPRLIRRALVNKSRVPEERLRSYAENFAKPGAARAALAYYRTAIRGAMTPWGMRTLRNGARRIRAPFLLLWGEEDVALERELTYGMERYFEHPPQVRYLPGVGHFVPLEAPEVVAESLREFLGGEAPTVEAR